MRVRRLLTVLSALLLLTAGLSACSQVSKDEVRRLGELPGVSDARRSCSLACLLSVEVEPDVTVDQLVRVLRAVRTIGAKDSDVTVQQPDAAGRPRVAIRTGSEAPAGGDTAAARLVTDAVAADDPVGMQVFRGRRETRVELRAGTSATELWDAARTWWPRARQVPRAVFGAQTVTDRSGGGSGEGPSRLEAKDSFPTASVRAARAVQAAPGVTPTGFLVDEERVRLAVLTLDAATRADDVVAGLPADQRSRIEVVVARNVLGTRTDDAAEDAARRRVLRAAGSVEGVSCRVDQGTVVVQALDARRARTAVERARSREAASAAKVPITVDLGQDRTVELGTEGSLTLVSLAGILLDGGAREVEVSLPNRGSRSAEPGGPDAYVSLTLDADDGLEATVTAVARRMRGFGADLSLVLSITARDPEGRTPRAMMRVERQDGTWTIVEDRDDRRLDPEASVRRAWAAGS